MIRLLRLAPNGKCGLKSAVILLTFAIAAALPVSASTTYSFTYENNSVVISTRPENVGLQNEQPKLGKPSTLTGRVVDHNGEPLLGATVMILGSQSGAVTDLDGRFTIVVGSYNLKASDKLEVSYMGYDDVLVQIGDKTSFEIKMTAASGEQIEEIVITGFQTISKTSFTGSSTKLATDDISIKGVSDVSRMLEGQVSGVSVQNVSGTFGAAPKVRVRGATSISGENKPLWVIDGVIQEDVINVSNDDLTSGDPATLLGSAVAGLNANDIESIDILKDASAAALYGARAMNGVVVVTTKRGESGAPKVTYSSNITVQLKPTYASYDIMNSADQMSLYAQLERNGYLNSDLVNYSNSGVYGKMYKLINTFNESTGRFGLENTAEARRAFLERYAKANTDWFDVLFRNSVTQEHSVSVSYGGEKAKSYVSLSFLNDDGWTIADKVNRYTANFRNDFTLGKKLNLGFQMVGSLRDQVAPGTLSRRSNTVEGSYDRDFDINPFSYALNTSRALTARDENGDLEYFTMNYAPFNIIQELANNRINLTVIDVKAQTDLRYKFNDHLSYEFTGAVRYVNSNREHEITENSNMANAYRADYTSTIRSANKFLYQDPDNPEAEKVVVLPYGGFYNRNENELMNYDIRNSFKYSRVFAKKHSVNALVGQQVKYADRQYFSNTGYGYQYDEGGKPYVDYRILKLMVERNFDYYSMSKTRDRFAAFYANADYAYDGRYVVAATVRYDGSNALGANATARWLPTWNVSGKWNVMNEPFMRNVRWINQLSLRASCGLTASMPPTANSSAVFVNVNTYRPYTTDIESAILLDAVENSQLTWEKGYLTNLGIDIGLFDRRLDMVVDCWWRNSFDLVSSITLSGIGGQMYKAANYADMTSHGLDVGIGAVPVKIGDFSWRVNFTLGFVDTKITTAKNLPSIYSLCKAGGGTLQGYPVNSLFSIRYEGLDSEGLPTFIDEDGKLSNNVYFQSTDVSHLKFEGTVDPKFTGGLSNTFRYKNLSLNVFLSFQGGNKIRLNPEFRSTYSDLSATTKSFFNRWIAPGDEKDTDIPAILDRMKASELSGTYPFSTYNFSSVRVAKGDFVRLKTVSLSYTVPQRLLRPLGIVNGVTLTCAGSNLWLLYSDPALNGMDPEFYNSGGVAQPLAKQITFALNVTF